MRRIQALAIIDRVYADRPLVVTCGATSRELAHLGRRDSHLYLLDAMGAAAAVGLGLALGGAGPLAAIEGDGSLLMGLSVLATIAHHRPDGLALIVLDNHEHASAARMPTQAATVDLAAICRSTGLPTCDVADEAGLERALRSARSGGPATVIVVRIEGGNADGVPLLLDDPVAIAQRFSAAVTAAAAS
jgi:sulfopyruvate decarboxylase subunit beta